MGYDDKRTTEILENTPARVRIRVTGNWDRTTGSTDDYLSNSTSVSIVYTVYADRYTVDFEWITSGAITISWQNFTSLDGDAANITSENSVYENSGSESDGVNGEYYDSADYIGWTSTELNAILIKLYDSTTNLRQRNYDEGGSLFVLNHDPSGAETINISTLYIIDSADRVGGKQYDSSTLRLALGDQYTDQDLYSNDFTGDAVACWNFESGAFASDSVGSNDLTNDGADEETTTYKRGSQSAGFVRTNTDKMTCTDANLDVGFPWRYDDTPTEEKDFNICVWLNLNSLPSTNAESQIIINKYVGASDDRVWALNVDKTNDRVLIVIGHTSGTLSEDAEHGSTLVTGRWYHISASYKHSDGAYRIRVWDDTAQAIHGSDKVGNFTNRIENRDVGVMIGSYNNAGDWLDGYLDELVVFNRVLTPYEIDAIRANRFSPLDAGGQVIDLNYPAIVTAGSFASDGAWHFEPDSSRALGLTWDTTRKRPNIVVHDYPYLTGAEESSLINHLKFDDFAASPCLASEVVQDVDDTFTGTNGDAPNVALWTETDTGNLQDIQSNKLNFNDTSAGSVWAWNVSKFFLEGAFDIQIDFDITTLDQPDTNINKMWFKVRSLASSSYLWSINRQRLVAGTHQYTVSDYDGEQAAYTTTDTSGKMRLVRVGNVITAYVWSGSQWEWNGNTSGEVLTDQVAHTDIVVDFGYGHSAQSGSTTMNVNYDNFTVNSGTPITSFWRLISDESLRDTDTHGDKSGSSINGETAMNTQDGIAYVDMDLTGHLNAFLKKGSAFIRFKPQFAYDVGASEATWYLFYDADNRVRLYYEFSTDQFIFAVNFGGQMRFAFGQVFTSNSSFQQWHEILCCWDYENDFLSMVENGVVCGIDSYGWTSATANDPTGFTIGCKPDTTIPTDIIIDEVKTYSECLKHPFASHMIDHLKLDEDAACPCLLSQNPSGVNDDFTGTDGDAPNVALWSITNQTGTPITIQSNKLNYNYTGTANAYSELGGLSRFTGDFDIQIDWDFSVCDVPDSGEKHRIMGLQVNDETDTNYLLIEVSRLSDTTYVYTVKGITTVSTSIATTDTSGKFRLKRVGSVFTGYYWDGSQWEWNSSTDGFTFDETFIDSVKPVIMMKKDASVGSDTLTSNADNFIVNSGTPITSFWRLLSDQSLRDTDTSGDSVEGVRANALDTQDGIAYIDMGVVGYSNDFLKKGSISLKFKPQFGYNDASHQTVFQAYVDANNQITLYYYATSDYYVAQLHVGGSSYNIQTSAYTSNTDLQQQHTVLFSWDLDRDFGMFALDGNIIGTSIPTATPGTGDPTSFQIGCGDSQGTPADIIIDEIKTFNECILPYGSVMVGNGEISADLQDPDILLHYDFEASGANATQIPSTKTVTLNGSAVLASTDPIYGIKHLDCVNPNDDASIPVTSYDIIDPRHGSISFWTQIKALPSAATFFIAMGNSSDYYNLFGIGLNSSNYWTVSYNANNVAESITGSDAVVVDRWYHVLFKMSDSNNDGFIELWIDGVLIGSDSVAEAYDYASGTLYLGGNITGTSGIDCFLDQLTITSNPNTPQQWTAFGKPLWNPAFEVSSTLIEMKQSRSPDGSIVMVPSEDVVVSDEWDLVET